MGTEAKEPATYGETGGELPDTASVYPLWALIGFLSAGGAIAIRLLMR